MAEPTARPVAVDGWYTTSDADGNAIYLHDIHVVMIKARTVEEGVVYQFTLITGQTIESTGPVPPAP